MRFIKLLVRYKFGLYLFRMFMLLLATLAVLIGISIIATVATLPDAMYANFFGVSELLVSISKKIIGFFLVVFFVSGFLVLLNIKPIKRVDDNSESYIVYAWCMSEGFSDLESRLISRIF